MSRFLRRDQAGWLCRPRHRGRPWIIGRACSASARSSTTSRCRSRTTGTGARAIEPHNSVALANSGPLQVELIQTRNDVPSMYRDFTQAGHTRPAACRLLDRRLTMPILARLMAQGFNPVMSGEVGERGRFVYFDTEYHPGHRDRAVGSRRAEGQDVPADPRGLRRLGRQGPGPSVPRSRPSSEARRCRTSHSRRPI